MVNISLLKEYTQLISIGEEMFVSLQQLIAPFLDLMPLMPPSFVRRASRALNPRQEQLSAAKKQKLLLLLMSAVTFQFPTATCQLKYENIRKCSNKMKPSKMTARTLTSSIFDLWTFREQKQVKYGPNFNILFLF